MTSTVPTSSRSSPPPIDQESSEQPGDDTGEGGSLKSLAFTFWKAFAREDVDLCRKALQRLVVLKNLDPAPFTDVLRQAGIRLSDPTVEVGTRGGSGKYIVAPGGTPKKVVETWNTDRGTTLMRIDPAEHCLSFDGDAKRDYMEGTIHFIACAQRQGKSADACAIGTHTDARRPKMEISGPGYAVQHRASSAATKPKVMAGVFLPESALPEGIIEGGVADLLEDLDAPPAVWFVLIKACPSKGALDHWFNTRKTEEWFLSTGMGRSPGEEVSPSTPKRPSQQSKDGRPVDEVSLHSQRSSQQDETQDEQGVDEGLEAEEQPLALRPRSNTATPCYTSLAVISPQQRFLPSIQLR